MSLNRDPKTGESERMYGLKFPTPVIMLVPERQVERSSDRNLGDMAVEICSKGADEIWKCKLTGNNISNNSVSNN